MNDKTFSIEERTSEEYDWENDTMKIIQKTVTVIDSMRMNEIVTHYECDLSDLREWLDMKNRARSGFATNADRIRSMPDEELAEMLSTLVDCACCPCKNGEDNCNCSDGTCQWQWVLWLKQEWKS